jgi:hypothetical protein
MGDPYGCPFCTHKQSRKAAEKTGAGHFSDACPVLAVRAGIGGKGTKILPYFGRNVLTSSVQFVIILT